MKARASPPFTFFLRPSIVRRAKVPTRKQRCKPTANFSGRQAPPLPARQTMPTPSKAMRIETWHRCRCWIPMIALFVVLRALAVQPTPVSDADAVCAKCHEKIFKDYLTTPMANASGLATEKLEPGTLEHSNSGTEYKVTMAGKQPQLEYRSLRDPKATGKVALLYFLGSGHLGTTYLYSTGDFLFESPVAWYASSRSYDLKPGLAEIDHIPPPLPMQSGCLRCHMSSVQASVPGTINRYQGLPFLHGGITCEACHGDSNEHVSSHGKSAIV